MHANRRNLQRKREKNRQKVAIFRLEMLDGAECHFRGFCFDVEARSEIPAYRSLLTFTDSKQCPYLAVVFTKLP